jgi:hypothetical protein
MFLLYHSEECNIYELVLCECYVNNLYTITYSGVLGHRTCHPRAGPGEARMRPPDSGARLCPPRMTGLDGAGQVMGQHHRKKKTHR